MTDWLSRAPSVDMIYFVPLEVAAACFFSLHDSGIGSMKFITSRDSSDPSSLSPLLDHLLSFNFLDLFCILSHFCCWVSSVSDFRVLVDLWLVQCRQRSSLIGLFYGFVHRSGGSGQPPAGCVTHTDSPTADASGAQELSAFQTQRLQSTQPLSQFQYGESKILH